MTQISALARALDYRRFRDKPRVLLFDADYLVVDDVGDAVEDLGWDVERLVTPRQGNGSGDFVRQLLEALVTFRPDYVLTVNHLGFDEEGALAGLLHRLGVATASWFVDHPLPVLGGATANATSSTQLFCFERAALPWLEAQGYGDPVYLPTASNARYFAPSALDQAVLRRLAHELTFAGNSWVTKARLEPPAWARKASKSFRGAKGVQQVLAERFVGPLKGKRLPPRGAYEVAKVVLAEASVLRRQQLACALARDGLRIHGDPHWSTLAPEVEIAPFLDYRAELPALFAASSINVNVTAAQMPTAVNQRVFDVPAVGGFLLTDAQEDALELFAEDREIVVYRGAEELADKVRYYAARPSERESIASRARALIDRYHRYTHRLALIDETMRARFA
jgi:spore maturation protein CgeB